MIFINITLKNFSKPKILCQIMIILRIHFYLTKKNLIWHNLNYSVFSEHSFDAWSMCGSCGINIISNKSKLSIKSWKYDSKYCKTSFHFWTHYDCIWLKYFNLKRLMQNLFQLLNRLFYSWTIFIHIEYVIKTFDSVTMQENIC